MKTKKRWIYLGIDQTGAIDQKGRPKPLPACLIKNNQIHLFYLESFSQKALETYIDRKKFHRLLICADCVLGLPKSLSINWRQALTHIENFEGYGRNPASRYFKFLAKGKEPRRAIEIACGANSVFKEKPFQKNIQTGTYRFWKDISKNKSDFYAPTLENQFHPQQLKVFEGYPSLSWKLLFSVKKRRPQDLRKLLKKRFPAIKFQMQHLRMVEKDPNLADALLLALTMRKFRREALLIKPHVEGSILGFKM